MIPVLGKTMKNSDNKLFQSAFKFASIGMAIVSTTGQWLMVNGTLCSMLGYSEDEFSKINFQKVTHPDDLEKDLKAVNQLVDGQIHTYQLEKRYIHRDGSIVWGLLSVSLIRNEEGHPLYFISQIQDITQHKKTEKLAAIYEFSVKLAHELNNPLTIISINCEVIDQLMKESNPDYQFIAQLNIKSAIAAARISAITREIKASESTMKVDHARSLQKQPEDPQTI